MSNIRGWIISEGQGATLSVASLNEEKFALASTSGNQRAISPAYNEVPAGGTLVELLDSSGAPLKSEKVDFKDGKFYTVIASESDEKWTLKVYADSAGDGASVLRALRILNFAGERATLFETAGAKPLKLEPSSIMEATYPAKILGGTIKVLAADGGPPAQSTVEVDFSVVPSAYVVIGPDYRGRMRPSVYIAGLSEFMPESLVPEGHQR